MGEGLRKVKWDGCIFRGAAMCLAAVILCGCGASDLLEQVPAEFSLQRGEPSQQEAGGYNGAQPREGEVIELLLEDIEDPAGESFLYDGGSRYAYESLSDDEKLWYRDMERLLGSMGEKATLSEEGIRAGLDEDVIDRIFQCVLCDHPELFFVEGYAYTLYTQAEKTIAIEFSGSYGMEREKAAERSREIRQAAGLILRDVPENGGDYEKVKYVYETLIRNTDYDIAADDSQNIYSVFVNRASVCQGYAKAFQYLLERMGIFCTLVQGNVLETGEGHAWNLVELDGEYYYVDATWGDISYRGTAGEPDESLPRISYDYLCITTDQLLRTHRIESIAPMPLCVATADNYYVREKALFSRYDREQMADLVAAAAEQGRGDITLRCDNEQCYRDMCDILLEQQEIFDYLPGTGTAYTKNDVQRTLTFFMMTNEG